MKKFTQFLISIIGFAFVLSAAVWFTLNFKPLYLLDVQAYDLEETSGMSHEDILANYDAMVDYNNLWGPYKLQFPTLPMSAGGEQHFAEVKALFSIFEWAAIISGVLLIIGLVILRSVKALRLTGWLAIGFPVVVGGAFGLFWDKMFVLFHKVFFANDFWIFDAKTDPVILILPDEFFLHCVLLIVGTMIIAGIICLIVSRKNPRSKTS